MQVLVTILVLGTIVCARDISVGSNDKGKKIFDEHLQASPAIWQQKQNVTVNTTDDEVISRVVVTDLREEKDGDANIIEGGEGQRNVTIELKSPTVLRGFDFHVEVYSLPNNQQRSINPSGTTQHETHHPKETAINDEANNRNTNFDAPPSRTNGRDSSTVTKVDSDRKTRDTEIKKNDENKQKGNPSLILDQDKSTTIQSNLKDTQTHRPRLLGKSSTSNLKNDETSDEEKRQVRDVDDKKKLKVSTIGLQNKNINDGHKTGEQDSTFSSTSKSPSLDTELKNYDSINYPGTIKNDKRDARATHDENNDKINQKHGHGSIHIPAVIREIPKVAAKDLPPENANKNFGIENNKGTKDTNEDGPSIIPLTQDPTRTARDTQKEEQGHVPRTLADNVKSVPNVMDKTTENKANSDQLNQHEGHDDKDSIFSIHKPNLDLKNGAPSSNANKPFGSAKDIAAKVTTPKYEDMAADEKHSTINIHSPRAHNYPVPYPYATTEKVSTTTKSQQKRNTDSSEADSKESNGKDKETKINPKILGEHNATKHNSDKIPVISIQ